MKTFFIIFGTFIFLVLGTAFYYGMFNKVNFIEKSIGGEVLVYQEMIGDYKQSGSKIDIVSQELKNNFNLDCQIGFGVYFDQPGQVAKEKLRSEVGCLLSKESISRFDEISLSKDLKIRRNPVARNIIGEFPYRNQISYFLGPLKIYSALNKYLKIHNYQAAPSMELYDSQKDRIEYRMVVVEK
jgi:hypothetical protein